MTVKCATFVLVENPWTYDLRSKTPISLSGTERRSCEGGRAMGVFLCLGAVTESPEL